MTCFLSTSGLTSFHFWYITSYLQLNYI